MRTIIERVDFPCKVFRGFGALGSLGDYCKTLGTKAFIVGGKTALTKTEQKLHVSLEKAGVSIAASRWYGGECSRRNINELVAATKQSQADCVIAVGGGKALDIGKIIAWECQLPVITVPTIAATCAAITTVSVVYTDEGEFVEIVSFDECPAATVIDTEVILDAPVRWLAAGMGDTMAKWYEYRVSIECAEKTSMTLAALANGRLCYDLIERFGGEARQAVESKIFHEALDSTVDAIILYAGLASIFGGEKIRSAAAHGLHNGLTKIPRAHEVGHGLLVGYGNLFLLALEDRPDAEIIEAIHIAERCAVPTTLSQLLDLTAEELTVVAAATILTPDMKNMPFTVTTDMVLQAIRRVDSLAGSLKA